MTLSELAPSLLSRSAAKPRFRAGRPLQPVSSRCFGDASRRRRCARHFVLSYSPHFVLRSIRLFDPSAASLGPPAAQARGKIQRPPASGGPRQCEHWEHSRAGGRHWSESRDLGRVCCWPPFASLRAGSRLLRNRSPALGGKSCPTPPDLK